MGMISGLMVWSTNMHELGEHVFTDTPADWLIIGGVASAGIGAITNIIKCVCPNSRNRPTPVDDLEAGGGGPDPVGQGRRLFASPTLEERRLLHDNVETYQIVL